MNGSETSNISPLNFNSIGTPSMSASNT